MSERALRRTAARSSAALTADTLPISTSAVRGAAPRRPPCTVWTSTANDEPGSPAAPLPLPDPPSSLPSPPKGYAEGKRTRWDRHSWNPFAIARSSVSPPGPALLSGAGEGSSRTSASAAALKSDAQAAPRAPGEAAAAARTAARCAPCATWRPREEAVARWVAWSTWREREVTWLMMSPGGWREGRRYISNSRRVKKGT